ncbi:MAG: response regulator [Rhodanobacter sp.]
MNNPLRAIVIEDQYLLAEAVSDALLKLGCDVLGSAGTVEGGLQLLESHACDFAVVDLDLHGEISSPILDLLCSRGIPFLLATGVFPEDIPNRHRGAVRLTKPYDMHEIRHALGILANTSGLACWAQYRSAAAIDGSCSRDARLAGSLGSPPTADAKA